MRTFDLRAGALAALLAAVALSCLAHCGRGDTCVRHSDCGDGLTCVEGRCTAPGPAEPIVVPPVVTPGTDASTPLVDASIPPADSSVPGDAAADASDLDASDLDAGDASDLDAGDLDAGDASFDAMDAGDADVDAADAQ